MKTEQFLQLRIWGWQVKNNKWIYVLLAGLFLVLIPVISAAICRNIQLDNYPVVYGYIIYTAQTITFALGCIPTLMTIYLTCHLDVGDCIVLYPEWSERKQCMIGYVFVAILLFLMMICLIVFFHKGISMDIFSRDLANLLIILWFLTAVARFLASIFRNVYFTLILIELYGVFFWNMGMQPGAVWNIFSLTGAEGSIWIIRAVLYLVMGILFQGFTDLIKKMHCLKQ